MYWLLHVLLILGLGFAYLEWRNRGEDANGVEPLTRGDDGPNSSSASGAQS